MPKTVKLYNIAQRKYPRRTSSVRRGATIVVADFKSTYDRMNTEKSPIFWESGKINYLLLKRQLLSGH